MEDSEAPGEIQGLTQSHSWGFSLSWVQHWPPVRWRSCLLVPTWLGLLPAWALPCHPLPQHTSSCLYFLSSKRARNCMPGGFFPKAGVIPTQRAGAQGKQGHRHVVTVCARLSGNAKFGKGGCVCSGARVQSGPWRAQKLKKRA